jgi:hypothetical protein
MNTFNKIAAAGLSSALLMLNLGAVVMAQGKTPPTALTPKSYQVTIKPGASYTVNALGFCISYAKPYPEDNVIFPGGRVKDEIVQVLTYAVKNKIITTTAVTDAAPFYQLEQAVWKAADGNWHDWMNRGLVDAQKIYSEALKTPAPAIPANAFYSPAYSKTLEITVAPMRLIPDSQSSGAPYLGETQIAIKNISSKSVKVAIAPGALAGSTQANQQDLGVMFAGLASGLPTSGEDAEAARAQDPAALILIAAGMAICALGIAQVWMDKTKLDKREVSAR